jgi:crotonobetainyl-CoA:carnitine CoA-transferase CaiB-like acyl-CoA transferase
MTGQDANAAGGDLAAEMFTELWAALGGTGTGRPDVRFSGSGTLPSRFAVTDFAAATLGTLGAAVAELAGTADTASAADGGRPAVAVDRELATEWCKPTARTVGGWASPGPSAFTGAYTTRDGRWIRFQMNYARQRAGTLAALGLDPDGPADRQAVARAVGERDGAELEQAVAAGTGAAALYRTAEEWAEHPQGMAVGAEPLVAAAYDRGTDDRSTGWAPLPGRPLSGIRVLDLTRVLAGPTATRYLAAYGAEVLRVDPPGFDEPRGTLVATFGKRSTALDLHTSDGLDQFMRLLSEADVLVHGFRAGVIERFGLDERARTLLRPGLVDVSLRAYGWTGPWTGRRGFDTLVEMANGMAAAGMDWAGASAPVLMPIQALDFGTGHLAAASAVRGLTHRLRTGQGSSWRLSLAATGSFLSSFRPRPGQRDLGDVEPPLDPLVRASALGPIRLPLPAVSVAGAPLYWDRGGDGYGMSAASWTSGSGAYISVGLQLYVFLI